MAKGEYYIIVFLVHDTTFIMWPYSDYSIYGQQNDEFKALLRSDNESLEPTEPDMACCLNSIETFRRVSV